MFIVIYKPWSILRDLNAKSENGCVISDRPDSSMNNGAGPYFLEQNFEPLANQKE